MQRNSDSTEREKVLTETDSIEMDLIETVSFPIPVPARRRKHGRKGKTDTDLEDSG